MRKISALALVGVLFSGCALLNYIPDVPQPTPVPTPTPLPTPTPTPTPIPTPTPPETNLGPYLDGTKVELEQVSPDPDPRVGQWVNGVISNLTGCSVGSDCVIIKRPQEFMADVIKGLRVLGYAAGQHEPGVSDEIAVSLPNPKANWEGYHIYSGAGWDDPSAVGKVVWFYKNASKEHPGSYRGAWKVKGIE